jgi:hypothetical protein
MNTENKKNVKSPPTGKKLENKFELLLTLITLLKNTRHRQKKSELEFLMVNQTFNLAPYRNCIYWEHKKKKVTIKNISGLVQIDTDGPYVQWLNRVIKNFVAVHKSKPLSAEDDNGKVKNSFSTLLDISAKDCKDADGSDWQKWATENALLILMHHKPQDIIGGLWIDRETPFTSLEKALLEDLVDGYTHSLKTLDAHGKKGKSSGLFSFFSFSGMRTKLFFLALILILFIPVRMSATAPAEVVASKPDAISIPFDGVIEKIVVSPGQKVKAGDVLVQMDATLLQNKVTLTTGELNAAQIALKKTERESMKDRTKLPEISILKAQLVQKNAEVTFAKEMLERAKILAERDGIVIFGDANSLRGKPVQTGEQIMQLADPKDRELLIRLPVGSMIKINKEVPARFFLNVTPLNSKEISYDSIGYQATMDTGGLLTYKIRGKFIDPEDDIRIGWTGTGKVYGERTVLGVNILRRPITTLRRKLGI